MAWWGLSRATRTRDKLHPADEAATLFALPELLARGLLFGQQLDEDFVERADELANLCESDAAVGCHEAVVPNLGEPVRQGVLEVPVQNLLIIKLIDQGSYGLLRHGNDVTRHLGRIMV